MLFNSIEFLIFFVIILFLFYLISPKIRWLFLLISSYYFYMSWKPEYAILIFITTIFSYFSAIKLAETKNPYKKKIYFLIGIFSSLSILFTFKYFNFFTQSILDFVNLFSLTFEPWTLNFLLPIGISFYTFQSIGYVVDVYQEKIKPEKHFGIFALYVSFFPQLVAGPIERAKHLLPQFRKKYIFNYNLFIEGLKLMTWGFFLKVVIADRLAIVVDQVYNHVNDYTGISLILATLFFTFQLYADFAAYSLIAIGAAKTIGYDLMDNFRRPYFSKNISEFWRRWHISLSTWFQDYVFTPFYYYIHNKNNFKKFNYRIKHFISFGISIILGEILLGLWHGANWTYILFGLWHGIFIFLFYIFRGYWNKLPILFQIFGTFIIFSLSLIFFRANSIQDAIYIFTNLFSGLSLNFSGVALGIGWVELFISIFLILLLLFVDFIFENKKTYNFIVKFNNIWFQRLIFINLIIFILFFGIFNSTQFVYFQF